MSSGRTRAMRSSPRWRRRVPSPTRPPGDLIEFKGRNAYFASPEQTTRRGSTSRATRRDGASTRRMIIRVGYRPARAFLCDDGKRSRRSRQRNGVSSNSSGVVRIVSAWGHTGGVGLMVVEPHSTQIRFRPFRRDRASCIRCWDLVDNRRTARRGRSLHRDTEIGQARRHPSIPSPG